MENLRERFVESALKYQKVKYVHQARSEWGVDCVGLIWKAALDIGINLPEYETDYCDIENFKIQLYLDNLMDQTQIAQIGDILAFKTENNEIIHHVAIKVDNEFMLHSIDRTRRPGVQITPLSWKKPDLIYDLDSLKISLS
jgi:cell wall-associated NlpC family hydrolase